jgi:hypothetical protein
MTESTDVRVCLLKDCCHGPAGHRVTISRSRARQLIADGRAVLAEAEKVVAPDGGLFAQAPPSDSIEVRVLCGGALKGTILQMNKNHARRLIDAGAAEEIGKEH